MKIKKVLLNNIGLKLLALVLALITWLYIGEVTQEGSGKTLVQKFLTSSYYISKKLIIQPNFVGEMPPGYKLLQDNIRIEPEYIVVLGPAKILSEKEFIYTKPVDLSEYTKTKTLDVGLENISHTIPVQKTDVKIFIPVKKIKAP
ncbi:MAG: YbbR-like domain-containing protein [Candidatus Omnitrophota bacterium]